MLQFVLRKNNQNKKQNEAYSLIYSFNSQMWPTEF